MCIPEDSHIDRLWRCMSWSEGNASLFDIKMMANISMISDKYHDLNPEQMDVEKIENALMGILEWTS